MIVTHRLKYACWACEEAVKGGLPTAAMVACVVVVKYAWHLPLDRQAKMLASQGIDLDRSTLAFWVGYAGAELQLQPRARMRP